MSSPFTSSGLSTSPRAGGKGWSLRLRSPLTIFPAYSSREPEAKAGAFAYRSRPRPLKPSARAGRQRLELSLTREVEVETSQDRTTREQDAKAMSLRSTFRPLTSSRAGGKGWSLRLHSPLTSRVVPTPFLSCDFPINAPLRTIGNTVVG